MDYRIRIFHWRKWQAICAELGQRAGLGAPAKPRFCPKVSRGLEWVVDVNAPFLIGLWYCWILIASWGSADCCEVPD